MSLTYLLLRVCRDAEVLSLFAAIINKLKDRMAKEVPTIFEAVFQVTLQMITKNFEVCNILISVQRQAALVVSDINTRRTPYDQHHACCKPIMWGWGNRIWGKEGSRKWESV